MSTLPADRREELDRLKWGSLAVGVAALLVCVIGFPFSPGQFFRAYLTAYLFYLGIALGCLAIVMVYHLTGGAWGFLIRHILEAAVRTLPLLTVLFVPIVFGLDDLYVWTGQEQGPASERLRHQEFYLNEPFFIGRVVAYFVLWLILAFFLSSWSRQQDESGDPLLARRLGWLSGPGLVVYGITITFASVDWVMSLQPEFRSTIFGPIFASGQVISGHAFALVILAWLVSRPPLSNLASPDALNDLGNLLFTFLVIWGYLVFFQYMLIWIANLPYDSSWVVPRSYGVWPFFTWALAIFHFAIPFFLLLARPIKRNPRALGMVAGVILFMQLVFMYYQVMPAPAFAETTLDEHWMDFLTPFGLGGLWLSYFLWQLKRRPVLPLHDPNRESAAHLRRSDEEEAAREAEVRHA